MYNSKKKFQSNAELSTVSLLYNPHINCKHTAISYGSDLVLLSIGSKVTLPPNNNNKNP